MTGNVESSHLINLYLCEIRPCTKNIVYARFEIFRAFLCVLMSVLGFFAR